MTTTNAMNADEAARFLGINPGTLAKWRVTGTGPDFVKAGRRVTYLKTDLEGWQATRRRRSTSDDGRSQAA